MNQGWLKLSVARFIGTGAGSEWWAVTHQESEANGLLSMNSKPGRVAVCAPVDRRATMALTE